MDIKEFGKAYEKANTYIDNDKMLKIIRDSYTPIKSNDLGYENLIITMEELSELNIELVKYMSKPSDRIPMTLIEELSDSLLSLNYVFDICGQTIDKIDFNSTVYLDRNSVLNKVIISNSLLQKEISKFLRDKSSEYKLCLIAFVTKSTIENAIACLNIKEDQINRAINVKLDRQEQRNCKSNAENMAEEKEFGDELTPDF
mgnify:CR=1 FL=1